MKIKNCVMLGIFVSGSSLFADAVSFEQKILRGFQSEFCKGDIGFMTTHCDEIPSYRTIAILEKEYDDYLRSQGKTTEEINDRKLGRVADQNGFIQTALLEICTPDEIASLIKMKSLAKEAYIEQLKNFVSDRCSEPLIAFGIKGESASEVKDNDL